MEPSKDRAGKHTRDPRDLTAEPPLAAPQVTWPSLGSDEYVWEGGSIASTGPAATRYSARGQTYEAAVPAFIGSRTPSIIGEVDLLAREAEIELARFDEESGHRLRAFVPILLRSEAASSSQIENLTASARQIFTAELGGKGPRNASEIAANTRAMITALELSQNLDVDSVRAMHRVLMEDFPRHTPGVYRSEAVWIGKSPSSPIGAEYVAPHSSRVPELMNDLAAYCARTDIPALIHLATAHAQFETIHPFTDGNGRTGRALAQAMLRKSGLTRNVAVPVSAGLLSDISGYHDALTEYRAGNPGAIVRQFAAASLRAVPNGRTLMDDLDGLAGEWGALIKAREGSVKARMVGFILERPAFTVGLAAEALQTPVTNVYRTLNEFRDAGILSLNVEHNGPSVWRAPAALDAIDRFAERAGRRGR